MLQLLDLLDVLRLDKLVERLLVMAALCGAFVSNVVDLGELLVFWLGTHRDLLFLVFDGLRVDRKVQMLLRRVIITATLSGDVDVRVRLNWLQVSSLYTQVIWARLVVSSFVIFSIRRFVNPGSGVNPLGRIDVIELVQIWYKILLDGLAFWSRGSWVCIVIIFL